jgi:alpha-amylase/alpha-mannosidase (GH57 family)
MVSSSDTRLNEVDNIKVEELVPSTTEENLGVTTTPIVEPLKTATGVYVTVHGHFYQPPRENPYLGTIERQPSAAPFHNWNERIYHECYRPNAFARVLNDRSELVGIVNNYEYLSFNIGATLMNWLEGYDKSVYHKIIEADRKSCQRLNGHGNAIAQVYNHVIMPLANERDKYTQIRWGKEDFRSHFGRDPEGMWLAETAVDYATLKALVAEGIKFIILAPSQAQRCRPLATEENPDPQWGDVGSGEIDPTRPYRCYLNGEGKANSSERPYIDIFFYDGPISNDMGFSDVLNSSHNLVARLGQAVRNDERPTQMISVATDGETFGHHKGGTEKCLAYAFSVEFAQQNWTVTNFAHYLSISPPSWEVELKSVTAWSCCHGVARWQDDCGCGGGGGWHQQWRRPLRESLNWLRDKLAEVYEDVGRHFFLDVWTARDEYIRVMRDRSSANVNHFLREHQAGELSEMEKVDALRLLEMQRHSLLMFTSCGWFFE